jgi:glycosyl transferase family 25
LNSPTSGIDFDKGMLLSRCGIYLINLDRSSDRLLSADKHFSAAGLPFERIVAIDAHKEDLSGYPIDRKVFQRTHGRATIRPGEIGCYFSHLKALRTFLESGREFGVILEDDTLPDPNLLEVIERLFDWSDEWDIVSLFHFHWGMPVIVRRDQRYALAVHLAHISSSAAYLVNRKAASSLLLHLKTMRACVDHSLYGQWKHGLRLRSALPMPISLAPEVSQSTINADAGGKPSVLHRLPTLLNRSYVAIRIFFSGLGQVFQAWMKL